MKQDKLVGVSRMRSAQWLSMFKPGDIVYVKHYESYVKAKLIRQKCQPTGAWICSKKLGKNGQKKA